MDFQFADVNVTINGQEILNNVSGSLVPGELMAIMGPSGAGKTTLLNTLNGRLPYTGVIAVGNMSLNKSVKRRMCYVLQQDFFFANLTLKETLEFTAMIRLPDEMSKEEKLYRMNLVVEALDLTKCLNTVMGGMNTAGLSGGERKRASIACELLRDPKIIFLDEPTTGLDSSTAASLISLLKAYAVNSKKTVIASIHQPSSHIFFQFDKLMLLTDGEVAYFGETVQVVDYFQNVGVPIDENYNPADFILEALSESADIKEKLLHAASKKESQKVETFENNYNNGTAKTSIFNELKSKLTTRFRKKAELPETVNDDKFSDMDPGSACMSLLVFELEPRYDFELPPGHLDNENIDNQKWPTGFWTQYSQLTLRTLRESRCRILNKSKICENLIICAFVCLMFFQLPRTEGTLRDRMGAVFFIAAHWGFIPLFDAVTSFPMERMVINKERSAGWYRLSAYYLAKMTSELVLILLQPTVFVIIAYWVIGLNGLSAFFATLGTIFIDSIAGQSMGLFLGIACEHINQSMTVSITLQMAVMLLGGLFTRNIPIWLDWMKYLSFLHYSFHSLMVLEFKNANPIQCLAPSNSSAFAICQTANTSSIPSEEILEYFNVSWSYWQYIVPLIAFSVVFRTLGYVTLRFYRKPF